MKFARYLDENTVPEWKKVYIQYRGLKKLIKRVAEHREARLRYEEELGITRTRSSDAPRSPAETFMRRRNPASQEQSSQRPLASSSGYVRSRDYGGTNAPPPPKMPPLPVVTLQGTGLRLSSDSLTYDGEAFNYPTHRPNPHLESDLEAQNAQSPIEEGPSNQLQESPSNDTNASADSGTEDSPTSPSAPPLHHSVHYDDDASPPPRPPPTALHPSRKTNTSTTSTSSKQRLLLRSGSLGRLSHRSSYSEKAPSTLDELISQYFDNEEAKMFSACNAELERIVAFYEAQEQEAHKKYSQLVRQLQELADHRREYRAKYGITDGERTGTGGSRRHRFSQLLSNLPGSKLMVANEVANRVKTSPAVQALKSGEGPAESAGRISTDQRQSREGENNSSDDDAGDKRRAQALAQMQANLKGWDDDTDRAIREANKAAAMSHDPEAYAAARKKLKAAVLEYYKFLDTLTNYKILNRTGFAKVMKKFSKTVGVPCTELYYQDKVAPTILVTSDRIEKLKKATEEIYTAYFEHGNRKQALNRLRAREDHTTHHYSVFRSGFYLGIALCAIVGGLIESQKAGTKRTIPQTNSLLRVFGAEFIPVLFALLFGLNLAWWHAVRINTVFIFEWDVRTTMDHRQFFEIPALLMLLLSCCFWVSFVNPFPDSIPPTTWPTVWLVIAATLLLNPLPVLMPASRAWFIKSWLRVFTAGWKRVEFRDFFLGDELNSLAWTMSNFWYIGCEWHHSWATPDKCLPNDTFWTAVLFSVPAWLRLGQCIRRWVDSDYKTHLHLVNAGKYSSAVIYNFVYIHYRRAEHGPQAGTAKAVWILFGVIYSLYHILWDLLMDWSVLRLRAKYFLLRNEISFPQPVYYIFMVVDVIGRSGWIVYLLPGLASVTLRSFLVALVEMIRRVCWNNLRVENEQIGNTDSFKIMRDLPLPYRQKMLREDSEPSEDQDGKNHKTGIFASVNLASLRRKKGAPSPAAHSPASEHEAIEREASNFADSSGGEEEPAEPAASAAKKGKKKNLMVGLRDALVPDAKGAEFGDRLDEKAVTKGQSGRDYEPRKGGVERGGMNIEDDSDDGSNDDDKRPQSRVKAQRSASGGVEVVVVQSKAESSEQERKMDRDEQVWEGRSSVGGSKSEVFHECT